MYYEQKLRLSHDFNCRAIKTLLLGRMVEYIKLSFSALCKFNGPGITELIFSILSTPSKNT